MLEFAQSRDVHGLIIVTSRRNRQNFASKLVMRLEHWQPPLQIYLLHMAGRVLQHLGSEQHWHFQYCFCFRLRQTQQQPGTLFLDEEWNSPFEWILFLFLESDAGTVLPEHVVLFLRFIVKCSVVWQGIPVIIKAAGSLLIQDTARTSVAPM